MRIINRYYSKDELEFVTADGREVLIPKNTFTVKLENNTYCFFIKGVDSYYRFMQDARYYQPDEFFFDKIVESKDATIEIITEEVVIEGNHVFSALFFVDDMVFLLCE